MNNTIEQQIITLRWDSRLPNKITCDVDTLFPLGKYYLYKHEYYKLEELLMGIVVHYKYKIGGCDFDMLEIIDSISNKEKARKLLTETITKL